MTRKPGRPRMDPTTRREMIGGTVHPNTRAYLEYLSRVHECSLSHCIDTLVTAVAKRDTGYQKTVGRPPHAIPSTTAGDN